MRGNYHQGVSQDWAAGGRVRQKRRTRAAVVAAARELTGNGRVPTMTEVAELAEVSQATAYRYFPTLESLLAEAALATYVAPIEQALTQARELVDVSDRLALVVRAIHDACAANELPWRRLLSRSLERLPAEALDEEHRRGVGRQGRRLAWLSDVLESQRSILSPVVFERLIQALTALSGIEALVTLRDVCHLSPDEAGDVQEWAARALLRGALPDTPVTRRRGTNGRQDTRQPRQPRGVRS